MPNFKGGKKYKAGKTSSDVKEMPEILWAEQTAGRLIKNLGDRNMMVYCNDGKERVCHIRGGLSKKKCNLEVGDIVIISLRGDQMGATHGDVKDRGDILTKFEREHHRALKKMDNINPKLFLQVEVMDDRQKDATVGDEESGFIFEQDSGDESSDDDVDETKEARKKKKAEAEKKLTELRNAKHNAKAEDDDIDIDNI